MMMDRWVSIWDDALKHKTDNHLTCFPSLEYFKDVLTCDPKYLIFYFST